MILQEVKVISSVEFMTIIVKVGLCILTLLHAYVFLIRRLITFQHEFGLRERLVEVKRRKREIEFLQVSSGF